MKQANNHQLSGSFAIPPVNIPRGVGNGAWGTLSGSDSYHASSDATLFSSSLPVLPHEKLNIAESVNVHQSVDDASADSNKLKQDVEGSDLLGPIETQGIGSLLPDDDELLAGILDFDLSGLPGSLDDLEDYDLFGSGGGMELESDLHDSLNMGMSKISLSDGVVGNGVPQQSLVNGVGTLAGEHPYGEHPSRTLFVRNINSNVEDSELRALFEQYGDIRTLYTACKHRGFVMISYYDIRAARTAMRALQNKALRRRKLDIHFSIPKDNPSDKDMNQGTLVVFNLDPSISNEDLRHIFGAYGEVKEIRETPHKRHHKFIEFYDVRAAEAALKSLNRSDIAGKRIKLEPSRPGGTRRNLMLQLNQDFEQDETQTLLQHVGSPLTNSPPGNWVHFHSPIEPNHLQAMSKSPGFRTMSPTTNNNLPGLVSVLHPQASAKVAPIGKDHIRGSHIGSMFSNTNSGLGVSFPHSHSLPEPKMGLYHGAVPSSSPAPNGSDMGKLSGPQFLWGSPNPYPEHSNLSGWSTSSVGHPYMTNGKNHGFQYPGRPGSFIGTSQNLHHHHVGSAPSGVHTERQFGYLAGSPETSFIGSPGFGNRGLGHNDGSFMMNMGARAAISSGVGIPGNISENPSSSFRMMSSSRLSPVFLANGQYPGPGLTPIGMEGLTDHGRSSRRVDNNGNQADSKKQFQLDLDKIIRGEDTRTTLMIKNIPNKYTSKMLLASIDENHRGTYDFLYLPIDFKNKCNVGYAFINMLSPKHIIPFYEAFNGKKWEKFNSEKVASLAYARIQGKVALVTHFQNSSLMNEDKRCRPILFHTEGPEANDQITQGHLSSGSLNIHVCQPNGPYSGDSPESPKKGENC